MASAGRLLCCLFRKYIRATPAAVAVDRNTVSILMFHQKQNKKKKKRRKIISRSKNANQYANVNENPAGHTRKVIACVSAYSTRIETMCLLLLYYYMIHSYLFAVCSCVCAAADTLWHLVCNPIILPMWWCVPGAHATGSHRRTHSTPEQPATAAAANAWGEWIYELAIRREQKKKINIQRGSKSLNLGAINKAPAITNYYVFLFT